MKIHIFYVVIVFLIIVGCAGKDIIEADKIPPLKPHLIPHQGDTGDVVDGDTLNFYTDNSENNGIDAVPSGDYINIQWEHLLDTDIDYLAIYRFNLNSIETPTLIDSIPTPYQDNYLDEFTNFNAQIGRSWFYYIKVVDTSGNYTISDTACYQLINKPILNSPDNGTTVANLSDVVFTWEPDLSGSTMAYRLLVFDRNYNIIWIYNPASNEALSVPYGGPDITGQQQIIWRVDAKGQTLDMTVNETDFTIYSGSESNERVIYIR